MKPLDDSVQHQNPVLDDMEGEAIWKGSRIYCCLVPLFCSPLCDPMDYSSPDSSVYGTSQARILEWVTISFSRGSSQPRDWTCIPCIRRQILCHWATREAQWDICCPVIQESWFLSAFYFDWLRGLDKKFIEFQLPAKWRFIFSPAWRQAARADALLRSLPILRFHIVIFPLWFPFPFYGSFIHEFI